MLESISDFITTITEYKINIPFPLQIIIIMILIISLSVGGYFMRDYFDISYMRGGMIWFIFIAVLNLTTILVLFLYNNRKTNPDNTDYVGRQGKQGKRGKMGKKGKSVTCSNCTNDLYIQSTRNNNIVCSLPIYTPQFTQIYDNIIFFQNIIDKGNDITYDNFVNGIILGKSVSASNTNLVNKFKNIMDSNSIAVLLVQALNNSVSKASSNNYGTFRSPNGKVGLNILGDSVYGGLENFSLNSFMVNGDIMYPSSYTKLVTFKIYNADTEIDQTYTIWRPIGQSIDDNNGFKGEKQTYNYVALGDMCRFGITEPKLNTSATIKETCASPIKSSELILVFIYVGTLSFEDKKTNLDYTKSDTYLIQNKVENNIEMFSIWRTPINTFITNCKSKNEIVNNSFVFNLYNSAYDSLNDYGNINTESKKYALNLLQSIPLSKILIAAIICKHYEIQLRKEIVYYFSRYQNQIPEFKEINPINASFGTLMNKIKDTIKLYNKFNNNLQKQASISLSAESKFVYDESKEKHLPQQLLLRYNYVNDKLLTISVQIENTSNLLDIINVVFDNGIETRIAKDAEGISEGGLLLNEIQITLLMICKMLFPPTQTAYMIKDECLSTFAIDRDREKIIKELSIEIEAYNKYSDVINSDTKNKYDSIKSNIRQYENLMQSQIGQLCGHIDNYYNKIKDMNLEEFTTSRIKKIGSLYKQMNLLFTQNNSDIP